MLLRKVFGIAAIVAILTSPVQGQILFGSADSARPAQTQLTPVAPSGQTPTAETEVPVIAAGRIKGGYDEIANTIIKFAKEKEFTLRAENLGGSVDNMNALANPSSPVVFALVQGDVYLGRKADERGKLEKNALLLAKGPKECAVVAASKRSGIEDDGDLASTRAKLYIVGSGALYMFGQLVKLEPDLSAIDVVTTDANGNDLSVNQAVDLILAEPAKPRAVMFVQTDYAALSDASVKVLDKMTVGELVQVAMNDWDFDDPLQGIGPLYTLDYARLQEGFIDTKQKSVCIRSVILYNPSKAKKMGLEPLVGELSNSANAALFTTGAAKK